MAMKERKQITGTTEQINAYKGHEGQIVWDKEKKTFVGMSGTAGKNYPLAPQAYVDNEIAKVNTELQETSAEVAKKQPQGDYATNTQLTEGLAGKEDKGTCLPLEQGGKLTKNSEGHDPYIGCATSDSRMRIWGGSGFEDGASLYLSGKDTTTDPSIFRLYANDGAVSKSLEGRPDGTLVWGGEPILRLSEERIYSKYGSVRFSNGLQLCWGTCANKKTTNFVAPFKSIHRVIASHIMGSTGGAALPMGTYQTNTTIYINDGTSTVDSTASYIAIGVWK